MKQVRRRTMILLCIAAFLAVGLLWFCVRWATQGRDWVNYFGNTSLFGNGAIYDRNGVLLYDGKTGEYAEQKSVRKATMHLVGDSNIATSMRNVLSDRLSGYHPITGTAFGSHDIYLTIDASLNDVAYQALNGKKGVVAVYNYKTGEILCLVSAPSYDPENPPNDVSGSQYQGVYLNRFFSSLFPPGSIFKVITTAATLEKKADWQSFRFDCDGKFEVGGQVITCPRAHGSNLTLQQAFARSCNGAYGQLALELGGEVLRSYAQSGGILNSYDISGVTTAAGQFDVGAAGTIDLAWSGSGQYHDMINPASFMMLMGGIANGGKAQVPVLLKKESFSDSSIPSSLKERSEGNAIWSRSTCDMLKQMMRNNVQETYGQKNFGDLTICAKSGTAEVGNGQAPHAWFSGFLDEADHPLAFIVLVENGGSGANVAGAVASKVLQKAAR